MAPQAVLSGVRVLSLEQVHVLPWGTAFLADFGAEVIRVESAEHMNDRRSGPFPDGQPGDEWWNEGGTFGYWARNKESLCLQVPHPLGKEVFLKLVAQSDIVTDNFRPGTMRRLGLDHDSLVKVKPDIITLSCTAYGHTGPWRAYGARARTVDAVCGLSALTGYEGGPAIRASSNYMDHTSGLNVAYALLLALYQRVQQATRSQYWMLYRARGPRSAARRHATASRHGSSVESATQRLSLPGHGSVDHAERRY